MRVVIQRVKRASVTTEKEDEERRTTQSAVAVTVSDIGKGLLCLVGVHEGDTREDAEWLCKRIVSAKLFEGMSETNSDKRWRSSVKQNAFEILVVSQARSNNRTFVVPPQCRLYSKVIACGKSGSAFLKGFTSRSAYHCVISPNSE